MLNEIIADSDTPFVYGYWGEDYGTGFRHITNLGTDRRVDIAEKQELPAGSQFEIPEDGFSSGAFYSTTEGVIDGRQLRVLGEDLAEGKALAEAGDPRFIITDDGKLKILKAGVFKA